MDDAGAAAPHVVVVGAGPSGFYAAEAMLKARPEARVDLVDRLPTPFGLVRYGVAPDHQRIKSVTKLFERTAADPRVRFLGNVEIGRDLTIEELRARYDAVVLAYGAPADRRLGIPGEDLYGSLSATDLVAWYNGHPDFADLQPPLDGERAVVVGVGNVAIDVSRILSKTVEELASSDIADHALEALRRSSVREVVIVGRRGPAEAKFTTKELRELGELADADVVVDPADLTVSDESLAAIANDPVALRNVEVLREFAARPLAGRSRRIVLRFLVSPIEVLRTADGRRMAGVVLERNELRVRPDGAIAAVGTGRTERLDAQLLLRSVGYRGVPLPGVPFDDRVGIVPNDRGRVLEAPGGARVPGLYVAGWIKRGPTGVIGTNKADAAETVASLLDDGAESGLGSGHAAARPAVDALELLRERGVDVVDYGRWSRIDTAELEAGASSGRVRVKLVSRAALMAAAGSGTSTTADDDASQANDSPMVQTSPR